MITVPELAAEAVGSFLGSEMQRTFGSSHARLAEFIPSAARLALECIGNSDALYHNVEHTMLVAIAGRDILRGRALLLRTTPSDWAHLLVACLMHDIGYVRDILKGDDAQGCVYDASGRKTSLPRGASDAALAPYHVDRSKLFVLERLGDIEFLDAGRIARAIEFTRFPNGAATHDKELDEDASLLRAADLIGQLGDPQYLRKANALYHEFEEIGLNRELGYACPADLVEQYPQFYWESVAPHVQTAIRYLEVTASGRQWIANLYSNVFRAERSLGSVSPCFLRERKADLKEIAGHARRAEANRSGHRAAPVAHRSRDTLTEPSPSRGSLARGIASPVPTTMPAATAITPNVK